MDQQQNSQNCPQHNRPNPEASSERETQQKGYSTPNYGPSPSVIPYDPPDVVSERSKLPDNKIVVGAAASALLTPIINQLLERAGVTLNADQLSQLAVVLFAVFGYLVPPKEGDTVK